ncbi:hypothetical protein BHE74_00045824 [Ensete ventricosum]|nr:hypothetical protein BHE74_00045824 [Ensete ventricosum]RZS17415.1 hypothetical protein BHM03_00049555 [Ensete ventricosum]
MAVVRDLKDFLFPVTSEQLCPNPTQNSKGEDASPSSSCLSLRDLSGDLVGGSKANHQKRPRPAGAGGRFGAEPRFRRTGEGGGLEAPARTNVCCPASSGSGSGRRRRSGRGGPESVRGLEGEQRKDPGIIPRNAHPPEPEIIEGNAEIGGVRTPQLRLPRTKDVNVNGIIVKVKYFFHLYLMGTNQVIFQVTGCKKFDKYLLNIFFDHFSLFVGQTTYENFRYRYDRRANPYNRGVVKNFKEIFFTSIPPSKNKFRARVPQEQRFQPRSAGGGFMSPNMGKAVGDIEMGRKPVTWDELRAITQIGDLEESLSNANIEDDKVGEFGEASTDLSREAVSTRSMEVQAALHDRRSSWGRGGSWERTYELQPVEATTGETNRMTSGNGSSNIATGN